MNVVDGTSTADFDLVGMQIDEVVGAKPLRFLTAYAFNILVIGVCIWSCVFVWNTWLFWCFLPIALLLIAARQHAILVLMHDASHFLVHENRFVNDVIGELLCAAPLFVSMSSYRQSHRAHHEFTNTEFDPDWQRKMNSAHQRYWKFPVQIRSIRYWASLYLDSIVFQFESLIDNSSKDESEKIHPAVRITKISIYLCVGVALFAFGFVDGFILFWLIPIVFVLPIIMRIRSISEHFALDYSSKYQSTRTVLPNLLERTLVAPHNIGYHIEHHLLPSVSWSQLPHLHSILMSQSEYRLDAHINDGYFSGNNTLSMDMRSVSPDFSPPSPSPESPPEPRELRAR